MSLKVEEALPPPHLFPGKASPWPSSYTSQACSLGSSPATRSPQPPHTYIRMHDRSMSSQNISQLPTPGWYDHSVTANEFQYTGYEPYVPPRSSAILSSTTPAFSHAGQAPISIAHVESSTGLLSPRPNYRRSSLLKESAHQSVELPTRSDSTSERSPMHVKADVHDHESARGGFPMVQPALGSSPWSVDPLGIQTPSLQSEAYYTNFAQHVRSTGHGERSMEMTPTGPHARRGFTPIAPQPMDTPRSMAAKRCREDGDGVEVCKRRRRSESTTSTQLELTEEDRLLLRLKEEEAMPWKEIAARFQGDLGKQYQIPALQMRLKRLRERMRVWSEADVRALRMAHEYWAQNKFDIISQKMLEYGAQEKWTARQCGRKWAESEGQPTPLAQYEQQAQPSFTPYSMSPAEPATSFLPYMHP
ncbi:hypothetical protein OPT61_g9818 [Boeremia exigua]|uniref:Uncharacterized protein n=1 Tax=Boeremia exigua TaxID=749465 RepID=A0ACC2HTJ6_9PLEO|nr:hypothetical protein OPT61_g9818 [Boeremia exigua]